MTRDKAINIVCKNHKLHRDVAASWVDTFAELGVLKLATPCTPPPEEASRHCPLDSEDRDFEHFEGMLEDRERG